MARSVARRRTTRSAASKKRSSGGVGWAIAALVVVVVVAGSIWYSNRSQAGSFNVNTIAYTCRLPIDSSTWSCVDTQDHPVTLDQIFANSEIEKYGDGYGLDIKVQRVEGKKIWMQDLLHLEAFSRFQQELRQGRMAKARDLRKDVTNAQEKLSTVSLDLNHSVIVDITDPLNAESIQQVKQNVSNLHLKQKIEAGHHVTVSFIRLADDDYRKREEIDSKNYSSAEEAQKAIEKSVEWVVADRAGKPNSKILTAFQKTFESLSGKNAIVYIFSDGVENTPEFSMYKAEDLAKAENYLKPGLNLFDPGSGKEPKDCKCSDLRGLSIVWLQPPRNGKSITQSLKIWSKILASPVSGNFQLVS